MSEPTFKSREAMKAIRARNSRIASGQTAAQAPAVIPAEEASDAGLTGLTELGTETSTNPDALEPVDPSVVTGVQTSIYTNEEAEAYEALANIGAVEAAIEAGTFSKEQVAVLERLRDNPRSGVLKLVE